MKRILIAALAAFLAAPAVSKEVGRFEGPQGAIVLDDTPGTCEDGWLRAEWRSAEGERVAGCWHAHKTEDGRSFILIAYEDGDRIAYLRELFKDAP